MEKRLIEIADGAFYILSHRKPFRLGIELET